MTTATRLGNRPGHRAERGCVRMNASTRSAQRAAHVAALRDLEARLDALVAEASELALPFGAEVSIWRSANDGGLKWSLSIPIDRPQR